MRISLFITCYNDLMFPDTGKAVVRVLERLGHTVEFRRRQTCCGQMHYNTGYQRDAFPMMLHFLEVFRGAETICAPSASCVAMIRDHFPVMADRAGPSVRRDVEALLPRVFEFSELLVDKLGVTGVARSSRIPSRCTLPATPSGRCTSAISPGACSRPCAGFASWSCPCANSVAASAERSP